MNGYLNCECPICGKLFHRKPSCIKKNKTNYCSRECHREAKKDYMSGEKNHQYGLKGDKNASWKSDIMVNSHGYRLVRKPNHPFCDKRGFVMEHRLVAEEIFALDDEISVSVNGKRYLSPEMVVHHKNFIRHDNRPENLQIMTHKEHQRLHNTLNPRCRNANGTFSSDKIQIKRVTETAILPTLGTDGSVGYDLRVDSDEPITINPHETVKIGTGLAFSLPKNHFGLIFARSGISTKRGLRPATCVSVIDMDYRGEVFVPTHNDTNIPQTIEPHERIAQMVIQEAVMFDIVEVDELAETDRGQGGFGSSGIF